MESSPRRHGSSPSSTPAGRLTVVCLSPQEWSVDLPTNRQQIMTRIAARGHDVLFVETGPWALRYVRTLIRGPRRASLLRQLVRRERVLPRLSVVKAPTILPWGHKYGLAARVNARLTAWAVRVRTRRTTAAHLVLWLYDPCFADCIGRVGERVAVYDCVDDYPEQTGGDDRKRALVTRYDRLAASRCRLVFVTTRPLLERHRANSPRTELVPNVGDYDHFAPAADRARAASAVAELSRPVIGFAGNFSANKVDFDLLEHVAEQRPEWTLLLVGPPRPETRERLDSLSTRPNVHVVPAQPYEALPSYVAAFDVALIPYVSNAYTRSCFPLKTFEYLAAGKAVVASGLPELAGLAPEVTLAAGQDAFVQAVEAALDRSAAVDVAPRQAVAAGNTWETRTERLLELVEAELVETPVLPEARAATTLSRRLICSSSSARGRTS
jgi:glycosyltransferase involved in cell wall biosynthesis